MIPIFGLIIGIVLGFVFDIHIPENYSSYVAVAILASLDSAFGGIVANLDDKFNFKIFISGFFGNAILAVLLTYIGEKLDVNLYLAAVIVFGTRLFNNFAILRRLLLNKS
jgi:small basic protein